MASSMSRVLSFSSPLKHLLLFSKPLCRIEFICSRHGRRFLFSQNILGLTNFNRHQVFVKDSLGSSKDTFISDMKECYNSSRVPYLKDLQNLIYIIETEDELEWTVDLVKRYYRHIDTSDIQYRFGPPLMRAIYLKNRTDLVLDLLHDPDMAKFMKNSSTYVTGLDLLFENGFHEDIVMIYEDLEHRMSFEVNSLVITVTLAALYKINTPDSMQKAMNFLDRWQKKERLPLCVIHIASLIALKLNDLDAACKLMSQIEKMFGYSYNMQIILLAKLGRLDEVGELLKSFKHLPFGSTLFFSETVEVLENALQEANRADLYQHLQSLKQAYPALFTVMQLDSCVLQNIKRNFNVRRSQKSQERKRNFQLGS